MMHLVFMENNITMIIIWLAIFIVTLVIELSTTQLVSIWFSGGAFVSMILACFDVAWQIQLLVFVLIALILLILTRPVILKALNKNNYHQHLNSVVGTLILLTKDVSIHQQGEGRIRDVVWTCKTEDTDTLHAGEYVKIIAVSGNSLIVSKNTEKKGK